MPQRATTGRSHADRFVVTTIAKAAIAGESIAWAAKAGIAGPGITDPFLATTHTGTLAFMDLSGNTPTIPGSTTVVGLALAPGPQDEGDTPFIAGCRGTSRIGLHRA